MEQSTLHRVLVGSARLQRIPAAIVVGLILASAGISSLFWRDAAIVPIGVAVASFASWLSLWLLPRRGLSFGLDKPSALALGVVYGGIAALLGLLDAAPILALALLAGIALAAFYATWIEPFRLGVTHEDFAAAGCASEPCLRLLHLGDLHIERITARERRLNALIAVLKPDVIVFSGDYVNLSYTDDAQSLADIRRVIGAWRAPYGVYCVPGTPVVEPLPRVVEFTRGLDNLMLLQNEWTRLETPAGTLHLFGMVTTHVLDVDRQTLAQAAITMPSDGTRIMLTHAPDVAPEAAAAGFDLYLCGHTHGGQIRLPLIGALLSSSQLGKRFVMGRYTVGAMTLYTTRGLGMEGLGAPRARLFCPPEVVLWRFHAPT
jgi:predicted MPP superfamily phosphohydrolase